MKHYKTIVVSDIHLGAEESKAKEIVRFLKNILATGLYLMAISLMAGSCADRANGKRNIPGFSGQY